MHFTPQATNMYTHSPELQSAAKQPVSREVGDTGSTWLHALRLPRGVVSKYIDSLYNSLLVAIAIDSSSCCF